ncbi:hypothetical protein RND81_14G007500 [Saponaria officinalis]|uniref:Uncharacterized protein n=1 Tax=Saponaria officinalis TaxID=3572 RepID=A0AAW1GHP7_SAPOF
MDLETENRIASILLKEAAELRRQAQQDGVFAYLRKPTVRGRPNSRFLTTTIRGIEQANRVVEVNEMWRAREKELEMDGRSKSKPKYEDSRDSRETHVELSRNRNRRDDPNATCSSSRRSYEEHGFGEDDSLKDEELEQFLQSRTKRGRGSVGPRMDETGPYLPRSSESQDRSCTSFDDFDGERPRRVSLGPERPSSLKRREYSDDEFEEEQKTAKKSRSGGSKKRDSKKHKSKDRDKKKKNKEKRHKR